MATHHFIGRQSNAITANEMAQYVVSSVFKELRARYGSETSPEARSFATGVETKLRQRVRELKAAAAADAKAATPGTSLVLVDLYASETAANAAWIKAQGVALKTQASRTKDTVSGSAYAAGKDYGGKVSLNTQLGAGKSSGVLRIK
jgi:DUF1365 family protein